MSIFEDLPKTESLTTVWKGRIAKAPSNEFGTVEITLDSFDSSLRFGPCRWGPRSAALPERGDLCIAVFDEDNRPYVIGWWPA